MSDVHRLYLRKLLIESMRQIRRLFITRSSSYSGGGGFGFTLRHFVIYPSSVSVNDIFQASYSVVIDEHQQKQLEEEDEEGETISTRFPSPIASSSSATHIHHQGEQQQQEEFLSSNSMKIIAGEGIEDDGTSIGNATNFQSFDTILVKEVRLDSPAYRSGLRQGDRLLSVNEQSIHGKSYSQVISIIQNTPTNLILNVIPKEEDTVSLSSNQSSLPLNRSSSSRPSLPIMSKNTIEQKLRNLQLNLAHGRTQEELAQAGVYFPSPPPPPPAINSSSSSQNVFSNYIDSVHKALDSSKQLSKDDARSYYQSPYHNEYIPYEYKQMNSSFLPMQDASMSDELKSPSTDSLTNDNDMKSEFVTFRKKQFESGHVENILRNSQRESKTKKYSEKKKYENEWTHLTAVADVESVMERASHFEDIDPDKFARLKSKHLNSPPLATGETSNFQDDYLNCNPLTNFYDTHSIKPTFGSSASSFSFPRANEMNDMEYNYDPRYTIESVRGNQTPTTHYASLTSNPSQQRNPYSTNSSSRTTSGVSLIRQDSYITAVRATHSNEPTDFVNLHAYTHLDLPFNPETPILRRKVSQYGQSERRTSYLLATDQRVANRGSYIPSDFGRTNQSEDYTYDQQQKIRNTPQHQTQAIKKLKNFFGEGTPEVAHALDHRSSFSPPTKSISYFDSTLIHSRESIPLTTLADHLEASKEGILYCKTVLKDGRRAADRSWRGAWAVLRRGALFLGKEKKHGLLIPLSCDSFPINLRYADVELASDYIKKPRVFKLTTSNQSEFLFQAPDLQSLTEWLDAINEHCLSSHDINEKENSQRQSTSSLPPSTTSQQDLLSSTEEQQQQQKLTPSIGGKSKTSARSPSLKRSPSLRFRKSQKPSITQPTQSISSLSALNSPSNVSPRRSFVKSIVKKGLRTLKSSSSILTSQMSGQIYDESSRESLSSATGGTNTLAQGVNFSIELEECEASSISRSIPIVVEILTRLVELRGINYQGIYRHAGGLTAVNWLVNELDKGAERVELNSEKWYDIKAVASTLKTFFAKLSDSLLSSKMSSLCVESSRIENHCPRLVELKRLVTQLDDFRFETLKYLCAHFRRVVSKCDINKIDARNLAIIFGPTLIWDSKASLQANLVDNPEKIRIIESFILYYEWFFNHNEYDDIPVEINPQMPKLQSLLTLHSLDYEGASLNNETKPSEIIQQIVRAAKRRWSSPLLLDSLSSLSTTTTPTDQQQTSKPINISVKRTRRRDKKEEKSSRSRSVDSSINGKLVSSSTDSAVYSMSDVSSSIIKKPSQSLKDISHFFQYFSLTNDKSKSKTLTNMRRKKSRKKITSDTFLPPVQKDEEELYERISNSSIGFIDQSPAHHQCDFVQQTSLLKSKLIQHENILNCLKQQISQVDQQLLIIQEDSMKSSDTIDLSRTQLIKRRHTLNSLFDLNCLFLEKEKHSSSSLYALQLL